MLKVAAEQACSVATPIEANHRRQSPLPLANLQTDAIPTKIQKSELAIGEPRRHRDKAHLKFMAFQPCLVCGTAPTPITSGSPSSVD
jgi:hypothetical protein